MDASFERDVSVIPLKELLHQSPTLHEKRHVQMSHGHVYRKDTIDLLHTSF